MRVFGWALWAEVESGSAHRCGCGCVGGGPSHPEGSGFLRGHLSPVSVRPGNAGSGLITRKESFSRVVAGGVASHGLDFQAPGCGRGLLSTGVGRVQVLGVPSTGAAFTQGELTSG